MKFLEFHVRIIKIMKNKLFQSNYENHEINRISCENHENYKNQMIPFENYEYHENL